ncbi:hypothetical protein QJQ45_001272 [Haematococcus lacustris]|nr:hypothetical protein QJQ45_001272 [Haematococcus lacustris]
MPTASKGLHGLDAHQPLPSVQVARLGEAGPGVGVAVQLGCGVRICLGGGVSASWSAPCCSPAAGLLPTAVAGVTAVVPPGAEAAGAGSQDQEDQEQQDDEAEAEIKSVEKGNGDQLPAASAEQKPADEANNNDCMRQHAKQQSSILNAAAAEDSAQDRALEQFIKKLEEDMAEVSMERHGHAKQLVIFSGTASIGTGGGGPRKPPQAPAALEPEPSTPLPAMRSKAEQAAEPSQPTKGQGKAAKAKPAPQAGRWVDRDCNAALNMQRVRVSRWRPLQLCWWPDHGALPAKGKEYPGLGYKRLLSAYN